MRFEVPQFINIPDKLFGPFTFKQALYLVGGAGMVFLIYKTLPFFASVILGGPIIALSLALVYYRPNGRPFIHMLESFIIYSFTQKFYLWRQREPEPGAQEVTQLHAPFENEGELPRDARSQNIADLAWSLDILDFEE